MSTQDQIANLLQTMEELEADQLSRIEQTQAKSRRVERFIYTLILLMGVLSLVNIYFVNDLTQEVRSVVRNMNEMYGHFARVSDLMTHMRDTVINMEQNVTMMPIMGEQMAEIGDDTATMKRSVAQMDSTMAILDRQIDAMNANVWDMSMRFRNMNFTVGNMGQDVHQFARPVP